jgi:glycosyltransferase involved in cell wall biosynthesis
MVTEIAWLRAHNIEIALWTSGPRAAPGPTLGIELGGTLTEAVAAFKPDIMHRWTHANPNVERVTAETIGQLGVPFTIRGHSHGFSVPLYRGLKSAARIWLFPHHAELVKQDNVESLPATYDPALFYPEPPQEYVVRAGACRPGKDIEGFIRVAVLAPSIKFVLIVTGSNVRYIDAIVQQAPANVTVHVHLPRHEAARIVRRARLCLRSHDTRGHTYGMPVSIVEALGAGLPVIARRADRAEAARFGPETFIGDAGLLYQTEEEAAQLVQEVFSWPVEQYREARKRALARASGWRTDLILPRIQAVWRELASGQT